MLHVQNLIKMKKIIYLTNPISLYNACSFTVNEIVDDIFVSFKTENSEIILLDDQADLKNENVKTSIASIFENVSLVNIRYVHHTNYGQDLEAYFRKNYNFVEKKNAFLGMHQKAGPLYNHLSLLFNNNSTLTDEIFKTIWDNIEKDEVIKEKNILNRKLDFLHKLLGGEVDKELKRQFEDEGYEIDYKKDDHINSIMKIRDNLLDKI